MPCFRLSILGSTVRSTVTSILFRSFFSPLLPCLVYPSLPSACLGALSRPSFGLPWGLTLQSRFDHCEFGSSLHRSGGSLRGDGKVVESRLWTERNQAVVFRWNRFLVSVFFPSLLVKARPRRQVSLLGISWSPERIEILSRHAWGIDHLPNYMVLRRVAKNEEVSLRERESALSLSVWLHRRASAPTKSEA